jgi:hypothetical protein
MITVQLPRPTLVEQERSQPGQNELLRAKQELQWEEIQVQQQHEKFARERCISAILAAHKRNRMPFEQLYQLPGDVQGETSRARELLRVTGEVCRRSHAILSNATLLVAYVPHALALAKVMPSRLNNLLSTIAMALGLRDHQKRSSAKGAKLSSAKGRKRPAAKGGKRTRALSCMERSGASHWAP